MRIIPANISQIIGVAFTFDASLSERKDIDVALSENDGEPPFSYFFKGTPSSLRRHNEEIILRNDPLTGKLAEHWPEPELAMLLGAEHKILGYCLANDLTAASIEIGQHEDILDSTYVGKVWNGSGSYGPIFVEFAADVDFDQIEVGLRIERNGIIIYDETYLLSLRNRNFSSIPDAIVRINNSFTEAPPQSMSINVSSDGFLPEGTLLFLGTGIIVNRDLYCKPGDNIEIYCNEIGVLRNEVSYEINY